MIKKVDKIHYYRNFQISLIISLVLVILCFLLFPRLYLVEDRPLYYGETMITAIDIPLTDQKPAAAIPPKPIIPSLFIEMDELELLPDIEIEDNSLDMQIDEGENTRVPADRIIQFNSLPYKPRKSYAHVPRISDCDGEIKLALLVGKDGRVKEHRILKNSIDSEECLQRVIDSMYKSRWMPVIIEGDRFEFWLEESVIF